MKNIHILPTDKPSRLSILNSGKLDFGPEIMSSSNSKPQHIYITSGEKIKVGDWVIEFQKNDNIEEVHFINGEYVIARDIQKKIILTTDQDLIKDGVQSIDDEFLEWFVKNPSCEEVEIERGYRGYNLVNYKIIIPKEEAKPHSFCETPEEKCKMNYCDENGCQNRKRELVEPKQETLEEAAERL